MIYQQSNIYDALVKIAGSDMADSLALSLADYGC